MTTTLRPPFAYTGAKTLIAPRIVKLLPPHTHYVEPFAGSLAVLLAKQPSLAETVNDIDGDLTHFWRTLRDYPEELARAVALTPHCRLDYVETRKQLADADSIEHARRVFVRITQSMTRTLEPGMWARYVRHASGPPLPTQIHRAAERIYGVAERLKDVSIDSYDAMERIEMYGREPSNLLYVDPPYEGLGKYRDDINHADLLRLLKKVPASVVLSGYPSPLYAEELPGWVEHEIQSRVGGRGTPSAARVEKVWVKRAYRY